MKRTVEVEVNPTPEELAQTWCEMSGDEQAQFFNAIGDIVNLWNKPFAYQLGFISNSQDLTKKGRAILINIGEYFC